MTNEEFIKSVTLDGEEWRTITNWDRYAVSNFGRIIAYSSPYICGGRVCYRKPQLIKPRNHGLYLSVVLSNGDRTRKCILVHRLVATAFLPNPNNLPFINHKDENGKNNYVDNLEWCTQKYNCNYGTHNARMAKTLSDTAYQKRKVVQLTLDGKYIATFDSIKSASQKVCSAHSAISKCCRNQISQSHGYKWMYLSDYETLINQNVNEHLPND